MSPSLFLALLCAAGLLLIILLAAWGRVARAGPDNRSSHGLADSYNLPEPLRRAAADLLEQRRVIEAIKEVREATGWDLRRAKEAVEGLEQEVGWASVARRTGRARGNPPDSVLRAQVKALLEARRKVEAVKLVRESTRWSLSDSKEYVERIQLEL